MRSILPLLCLVACVPKTQRTGLDLAAVDATLRARLDRLVGQVEAAREEHHIPGLALAVVRDGEVLLLRGFGVADVGEGTAVTATTPFALGDLSMAFTSAAVARDVAEGRLTWDTPVATHLPSLRLADDDLTRSVTLRDALAQRTGYRATPTLWRAGRVDRDTLASALTEATPPHALGAEWHDNRVLFTLAGESAAAAADLDWEEWIGDRLFHPLGLRATVPGPQQAVDRLGQQRGYLWPGGSRPVVELKLRQTRPVAPARGIHSTAADMARWLMFLLDGGEVDGETVLPAAALSDTWADQSLPTELGGHGLGWDLDRWREQLVVHRTGHTDGFTAHVAFLPGEELGYALLTNLDQAGLAARADDLVFGTLLGRPGHTLPARGLEPFEGTWLDLPSGGQARTWAREGRLWLDPGGTPCPLRRSADAWVCGEDVTVTFRQGTEPRATALRLTIGADTTELPRAGIPRPPLRDTRHLDPYLGVFGPLDGEPTTTVTVQRGVLVATLDGGQSWDLTDPDALGAADVIGRRGLWALFSRALPVSEPEEEEEPAAPEPEIDPLDYDLYGDPPPLDTPEVDETGPFISLTLHETTGPIPLVRLGDAPAAPPSVEDMELAVRAGLGLPWDAEPPPLCASSTVHRPHEGLTAVMHVCTEDRTHLATVFDAGAYGSWAELVDGDTGGRAGPLTQRAPMSDAEREQTILLGPWGLAGSWRRAFSATEMLGAGAVDGHPTWRVLLETLHGPPITIDVDRASGLVRRIETRALVGGRDSGQPLIRVQRDFRSVGGVWLAWETRTDHPQLGTSTVTVTSATLEADWGTLLDLFARMAR